MATPRLFRKLSAVCRRAAARARLEGVSREREHARRPGAGRWLLYAFGGQLPARYRDWVYADLTGPDWRLREVGRIMLFAVVPVTVLLLLPGPLDVRVYAALFVVIGPAFVGLAYGDELRDRRLRQHDLLPPQRPESG